MENASKALLIAGAILLAILIISLSIIAYNQTQEKVASVNLSEEEIQAFNSTFIKYQGKEISGASVNELIQKVISANQTAINNETRAYIAISFPSITEEFSYGGLEGGQRAALIGVDATLKEMRYVEWGCVKKLPDDPIGDYTKFNDFLKIDTPYYFHSETKGLYRMKEGNPNPESIEISKEPTVALRVKSGQTYDVRFAYNDGRISRISVERTRK